jgi:hypothetical protein
MLGRSTCGSSAVAMWRTTDQAARAPPILRTCTAFPHLFERYSRTGRGDSIPTTRYSASRSRSSATEPSAGASGKRRRQSPSRRRRRSRPVRSAGSVDTGDERRDAHLRGDGFLAVLEHPEISFEMSDIEQVGHLWQIAADVTIRNRTRVVEMVVHIGENSDTERRRLMIYGQLDRHEFGLRWNRAIEAAGAVAPVVRFAFDLRSSARPRDRHRSRGSGNTPSMKRMVRMPSSVLHPRSRCHP